MSQFNIDVLLIKYECECRLCRSYSIVLPDGTQRVLNHSRLGELQALGAVPIASEAEKQSISSNFSQVTCNLYQWYSGQFAGG